MVGSVSYISAICFIIKISAISFPVSDSSFAEPAGHTADYLSNMLYRRVVPFVIETAQTVVRAITSPSISSSMICVMISLTPRVKYHAGTL